jgi:hypothetical protein
MARARPDRPRPLPEAGAPDEDPFGLALLDAPLPEAPPPEPAAPDASPDDGPRFAAGERVAVLPFGAVDHVLDYRAPEGGVEEGAFVEAPLGPRRIIGVVWGAGMGDFPAERLRPLVRRVDAPPLRAPLREFLERAAAYTLTPLPAMVRLATRAPGLADAPATRHVFRRGPREATRVTDARARVLAVLEERGGLSFTLGELASAAGVGTAVIRGLVTQGAIVEEEAPRDQPYPRLDLGGPGIALTPDQMLAAASLRIGAESRAFGATLLKGVTGSGKTEVYLEAGRRDAAPGPPSPRAAARDRPHRRLPRARRGPLRGVRRRVALGPDADRAAAALAHERHGGREPRRRRALRAVPALPRPRPDRRG